MPSSIRFPFPPFFGVSFFKNVKEITTDGYKLPRVDPNDLQWELYWHGIENGYVYAAKTPYPLRILGTPDHATGGQTAEAVMEVPACVWLIHNFKSMWYELIATLREVKVEDVRKRRDRSR